jgi:hypothetical protein
VIRLRPAVPQRSVGLDELMDVGEDEFEPAPRIGWPGFVRRALYIAVLSALLASVLSFGVLPLARLSVPFVLLLGGIAGLLTLRAVAGSVAQAEELHAGALVRMASGATRETIPHLYDDGLYRTLRRWEMRLDWAGTERARFQRRMPGLLGELVDERLRQHHGITRASDPARSRQLCGERLWAFLHEELPGVPAPRELVALVEKMETI